MKLSFLVTVHNEDQDLEILLDQLIEYKLSNEEDEIVVLDDNSDNPKTLEILKERIDHIRWVKHSLNLDFGSHKQHGNEQCTGDFIFQIDADEYFAEDLLHGLKGLVESNPDVELFLVPRINIIRGMTEKDATTWGWEISKLEGIGNEKEFTTEDEEYMFLRKHGFTNSEEPVDSITVNVQYDYPIINWRGGDYQFRFYKNSPHIKWERPLHELVTGAKQMTQIPRDPNWALIHDKSMKKQMSQNMFYNQNFSQEMNVRTS
jgi:glycosyltransferase involved in cell wall biosynthesis